MRRRIDLHRRREYRVVSDGNPRDVEHHAVEVEEDMLADFDVRPVITVERWLNPGRLSSLPEEACQNASALVLLSILQRIQFAKKTSCASPRLCEPLIGRRSGEHTSELQSRGPLR